MVVDGVRAVGEVVGFEKEAQKEGRAVIELASCWRAFFSPPLTSGVR